MKHINKLHKTIRVAGIIMVFGSFFTLTAINQPKLQSQQIEENQEWNTIEVIEDYQPNKIPTHNIFLNIDNDQVRKEWKYFEGEMKNWGAKETSWHCWHDDKGAGWEDTHAGLTTFENYNGRSIKPLILGENKLWGKFTPSQNCNLQLEIANTVIANYPLEAGTEYEIWISSSKLWLRYKKNDKRLPTTASQLIVWNKHEKSCHQ